MFLNFTILIMACYLLNLEHTRLKDNWSDQSYTRYDSYLNSSCYPQAQYSLIVQNSGLKHHLIHFSLNPFEIEKGVGQ